MKHEEVYASFQTSQYKKGGKKGSGKRHILYNNTSRCR